MSAILKFIRENHILALIEQAIAKKKSRLSLNAFEIVEIPNLLYTCLDVEHLYLHRNSIATLPVQITQLVNLTSLTLDYNNITALPSEIGSLKNLVNLNISYNPLKVLIPEIGELENLEAFWCNRIGLREIPKEIGKLVKLDTFGARGNELRTIPDEMTNLSKLRWLTLEHNQISHLPSTLDGMQALVHCNLRHNHLKEFPVALLKCADIMYAQFNDNLISSLPEEFDISKLASLEIIDLRGNPICEAAHPEHPLIRYTDAPPASDDESQASSSRHVATRALAVNATQLRHPAQPAPNDPLILAVNGTQIRLQGVVAQPAAAAADPVILDMELDSSSVESSEDWENSVNSSELDVQYQSDEERIDNEAVGMVLPELSKYASTAS